MIKKYQDTPGPLPYTEADKRAITEGINKTVQQHLENTRNRTKSRDIGSQKINQDKINILKNDLEIASQDKEWASYYLNALLSEVERRKNGQPRARTFTEGFNVYNWYNPNHIQSEMFNVIPELSDLELKEEIAFATDWNNWINTVLTEYPSQIANATVPLPRCAATALQDHGINNITGNQSWASHYKEYGYRKRQSNEPHRDGDLVQITSGGIPNHMMTVDGDGTYNYAPGFTDRYVVRGRMPKELNEDDERTYYEFIGTPTDSLRWANEARATQGLPLLQKNGGFLKRVK